MLPNTITLAVDLLNNGTTSDEVFQRLEELVNRSTYRGPNHSSASKNTMQFYRTLPKRSGNSLGTAKVAMKLTTDKVVLGSDGNDITAPLIAEIGFSLPVGVTAADMKALRQRIIASLDQDAVWDLVQNYQEI
jgi:hypothetical protein